MIPVPRRLFTLAMKTESNIGTSVTLSAADAVFRVMNPSLTPVGSSLVIPGGTGLRDIAAIAGVVSANLNYSMELYATSSWYSTMLPACGFALSATSGRYQICDVVSVGATSNQWSSVTAGLWFSTAQKFGIFGAMGSVGFDLTADMPFTAGFNFKGVYLADPGTLVSPTYETSRPGIFNSFTIDGSAAVALPSVSIKSDDYTALIPQPNAQGGILHAWQRKQNWRLRFAPYRTSGDGYESDWLGNATGHSFAAGAGVGSGATITLGGVIVQTTSPGQDEADELLTAPLEWAILENSLYLKIN